MVFHTLKFPPKTQFFYPLKHIQQPRNLELLFAMKIKDVSETQLMFNLKTAYFSVLRKRNVKNKGNFCLLGNGLKIEAEIEDDEDRTKI